MYNMTCLECLNATSVVAYRCAELTNLYPCLSAAASISKFTNLEHLTNLDIDLEIPSESNFKYYSTHDFHSDYDISECFKNNLFQQFQQFIAILEVCQQILITCLI